MTYIRNSTVVAEMLKKNHDCNKLKDDFEQIIHNVRNKEDDEIVRKHILLMFDELLMNEVKEKIDDMAQRNKFKNEIVRIPSYQPFVFKSLYPDFLESNYFDR